MWSNLLVVTIVLLVGQWTFTCNAQDLESLQTLVMQQAQVISQMQGQMAEMQGELVKQSRDAGFYVRFSDHQHQLQTNKTVVFDVEELDEGGYYDNTTGIFTAPVSGLYLFHLKITQIPPGSVHAQIRTDGDPKRIVEVSSNSDTDKDRSSATGLAHLTEGQQVFVYCPAHETTATQLSGWYMSTYFGVLIKAD